MPRRVLTPRLIEDLPRLAAEATSVSALARQLGVKHSTLRYHLRGGKGTRYGESWSPLLHNAQRALATGRFTEAAAAYREAADRLVRFAGTTG